MCVCRVPNLCVRSRLAGTVAVPDSQEFPHFASLLAGSGGCLWPRLRGATHDDGSRVKGNQSWPREQGDHHYHPHQAQRSAEAASSYSTASPLALTAPQFPCSQLRKCLYLATACTGQHSYLGTGISQNFVPLTRSRIIINASVPKPKSSHSKRTGPSNA
jgi:hypothetical protein